MNKLNSLSKLAIAGIAAGVSALAIPMNAEAAYFKLDDYNVDDLRSVPTTGFITDVTKADINSDIWPATWDRVRLEAINVTGDPGEARLCPDCEAFEMLSGAGDSQNIANVYYEGPEFDFSVYDGWMPQYSADLDGGDLRLYGDGALIATAESVPQYIPGVGLPNTGGAGPAFLETLMIDWVPGADLTVSTLRVEIDGTGVGNLDFTVDHVKAAPEPGTIIGLLAISGLGFGLKRKKQS